MFIQDLKPGMSLNADFLVAQHAIKTARNGKEYQFFKLQDRTGSMDAFNFHFRSGQSYEFREGEILSARGSVQEFKGNVQIHLQDVQPSGAAFDRTRFLPATSEDIDDLFQRLDRLINAVQDRMLKKLLVLASQDPEIRGRLRYAPAAKSMHHACIGGLLEHLVSVMELAGRICPHYPRIDADMVLAGAFFHDMGKLYELEYETSFEYSTRGMLIGHLVIGVEIIDRFAQHIRDFPSARLLELKHIVLSHHGELEYGSPKRPKTLEAMLVHYLDDMDARLAALSDLLGTTSGEWTQMHRIVGRRFYNPGFQDSGTSAVRTRSEEIDSGDVPAATKKAAKSEADLDSRRKNADKFHNNPFQEVENLLPFDDSREDSP